MLIVLEAIEDDWLFLYPKLKYYLVIIQDIVLVKKEVVEVHLNNGEKHFGAKEIFVSVYKTILVLEVYFDFGDVGHISKDEI